ncbi:MAG: alpha/beta hydrolase [Myxococcota bacterium]
MPSLTPSPTPLNPSSAATDDRLLALDPPHRWLLLAESRAFSEYALCVATAPLRLRWPRGDGHPVITLPGLGASDRSMRPMRRLLRHLGYFAHGWKQGLNRGRPEAEDGLLARVRNLYRRHGQPVSLVGWSMGGLYAREVAKRAPEAVRQVITLASPFTGHPFASNALTAYRWLSRRALEIEPRWFSFREPPPVPTTSIYSRSDGIVHWRCTLNPPHPQAENIRIEASHFGIGHHPLAFFAIADRLAQPAQAWRPFRPQGLTRHLFPEPDRGE